MTTYALLRKTPEQKIARPFNRTSSKDETVEILQAFATRQGGGNNAEVKAAMERASSLPEEHAEALGMNWRNLNTDLPLVTLGRDKFYIFTEE